MDEPERPPEATDRWLTSGVRDIGLASFLSDSGHEIPTSLLPSFLTVTLGAPASALGLIEGIALREGPRIPRAAQAPVRSTPTCQAAIASPTALESTAVTA